MKRKQLLERLSDLIDRAIGFDFHVSEETQHLSAASPFVPRVTVLLEESIQLLRDLQDFYETDEVDEAGGEVDSLSDIGALISTEMATRGIADLAFVARGELRDCLRALQLAVEQNNLLRVASNCDSGLRRIKKALICVESAICEYEGRVAPMRVWYDLDLSLEIRRRYGELRRQILGSGPPEERELDWRMGLVCEAFNHLRSLPVYPLLRIDDRVHMRRIQRRILDWQASGQDPQAGQRLWQDLLGFAELLAMISNRQELREHDRKLVRRVHHELHAQRISRAGFNEQLRDDLQALRGLDDSLDELLEDPETKPFKDWLLTLARLAASLDPSSVPRGTLALP